MKKILIISGIFAFQFQILTSQNVTIPDATFKAALLGNSSINTDADTNIQVSEAIAYNGAISVNSMGINDLTGIEAFVNIVSLNCNYNNLTSLNVSSNTALIILNCANNQLTSLNVSSNTLLTSLVCNNNLLTGLDVSTNTALTLVICDVNQMSSLDFSTNIALATLNCGSNQLTSLNLPTGSALVTLVCPGNQLANLDVSANSALANLTCFSNLLTGLDVSANNSLTYLSCEGNQITSLDLSGNNQLTWLVCHLNQLICLNVQNGNNNNFSFFKANNNPGLSCIQVDDTTYSNTNWTMVDASANFSTNCPWSCSTVGINNDLSTTHKFTIYPNPLAEDAIIEYTLNADAFVQLEIYNIYSSIVKSLINAPQKSGDYQYSFGSATNSSNGCLQPGIYFVSLSIDGKNTVMRIVIPQ